MRKKIITGFFVAVVPLLCAQLLFVRYFGEPFPSVRFPGFGVIYSSSYPVEYTNMNAVLFSKEDSLELTLNELIPTPQYAKVFFINMRAKLKKLPAQVTYESSTQLEKELLHFFKERTLQNTKFRSLDKIELRWYRNKVATPNEAPASTVINKRVLIYT